MKLRPIFSPHTRLGLKCALILLVALLLGGAATIPFLWPSTSLWYKFGTDKTLLQAGKVAGLSCAVMVFMQILLASRCLLLDRILGLDKIFLLHQLNGFLLIFLAMAHAFLILIPEGIENLPIGWKFWPEMVGATTLFFLLTMIFTSKLREMIMPYHLWRMMHRPLGYLLVAVMCVHVITVSDSFVQDVPKTGFYTLVAASLISAAVARLHAFMQSIRYRSVDFISQLSHRVILLQVEPPPKFAYAPGQFAFIRLKGKGISKEPHPFTIASCPGSVKALQFMIKKCGDWTTSIKEGSGVKAAVEGPYGLFSYKAERNISHLVLIGAGIGITPMISMLRQIATEKDQPAILLLWSLHWKDEAFLSDELKTLGREIPSLAYHLIFTRETSGERIDRSLLKRHLENFPTSSHCYICGPKKMMGQTGKHLLALGFSKNRIHREMFSL